MIYRADEKRFLIKIKQAEEDSKNTIAKYDQKENSSPFLGDFPISFL